YPSGRIHMGHVRNYSIGDVLARFLKMKGQNVIHPMGWDSFGLPAENAAIERGVPPAKWTRENIDYMRGQLKQLGLGYDWSRELATCEPDYYRWNQWIFLKFLEKGLAYKKRSSVNWCPKCATVLANEQVDEGLCWRCASVVDKRSLEQWFFKITAYAEELLQGTEKLTGWPERVLTMQRNWIGKSTGVEANFNVVGTADAFIKVFTTRPDTMYGVTFMSLAPEHPLLRTLTPDSHLEEVRTFVEGVMKEKAVAGPGGLDKMEKKGVDTGIRCFNPITGEQVPVYVANFVLMEYGTGAVMAVPAHDQRDFEFAKKYDIPINVVINPPGVELDGKTMEEAFTGEGTLTDSGPFDGLTTDNAKKAITNYIEEKWAGEACVNYRLRDWGVSRQRYWGCPIPVIYCDKCGAVPVPAEALPVLLPDNVMFTGKGGSPLAEAEGFVNTTCPACDAPARRETDTMDTFVDSSWYFLRYTSPKEDKKPFTKEDAGYWMPVDQYIGGIEHAVMHLLYARFFTKALRDIGLCKVDEPFKNLLTQGMVCKETQKCPDHGFLLPEEVTTEGNCKKCSASVVTGPVEKMSKSKKNTVDPSGIIARYGADTTRLFSLFAAPPERDLEFSIDGVEGSYRFLGRVWRLVVDNLTLLSESAPYHAEKHGPLEAGPLKELHSTTHRTIEKVTSDIGRRFHFNTAISSIMELVNAIYGTLQKGGGILNTGVGPKVFREAAEAVVLLLSPFAPHITEELWSRLGATAPIYETPWPAFDEAALAREEVTLVIQINGKVRSRMVIAVGAAEEEVLEMVKKDSSLTQWIEGGEIKKVIYVPDKILNMVIK
ncbi:MAG: leucine--tRNA ligase, partial [Thermodesulfobacteriota bacterium]